ncbi:hypothetical protein AN685_0208360 [Enterobacter roggenkampii]|uniref:hypothetical protein n=1 Tax=Enterobacter roggenkampii TaxID=1812935 RepID=UPI0006DA0B2A|nr:hypothetical protein [Enterobacter roggenkampii]OEH09155.1 hypothetical protein AN685_0208360 [Enterobacter roggenkampii]
MTTITRERLRIIQQWRETYGPGSNVVLPAAEAETLARIAYESLGAEPIYQCEFCHHDGNGELQWHWEDVNKDFYDQYDPERSGKRRVLYSAPLMPALANGWVVVPVEPTEDMIVQGFESEPDESFNDADVWEAYEAMSGCQQAAHRAKLCWSAMLAAAPKPEA